MSSGLKAIVILMIACAFLPPPAAAGGLDYSAGFIPQAPDGFSTIHGHDFDVSYGTASAGEAGVVETDASGAYGRASAFFHGAPFHPTIIVASTHEEYENILDAENLPDYSMSSGWGDGDKGVIVIKRPGLVPDFQVAMTHEMVHVAARSYIQGYKYALPDWFSEGLAVYVSGDLPAAKIGVVEDKCRNGGLMSIDELDRVHRLSATDQVTPDQVGLAYTQAGLLVKYIADRYGGEALLRILDRFGPGADLNGAFVSAIGETPDQVNRGWQAELKAELDRRDGRVLEQTVHGYIVDQHGRPMPNETVSFTALRNDSPVQGTVYRAVANGTGQYSVKVTYGSLEAVSEKPGYEGFNQAISLARNQSLFLNVTLNGTALEEAMAKEKAEQGRKNTIYAGLGALTLVAIAAALAVFIRSRKR